MLEKNIRRYILPIFVIIMVAGISVFATKFFDSKINNKKLSETKGYLIYNKGEVKIYGGGASDTIIDPSYSNTNQGVENYVFVRIEDGNKMPINIVYQNFDASALVQTVNDNFIIIPIITAVNTIDSVFVANRKTREVLRYPINQSAETYIAFTNDVQKLIYNDLKKEQIIVTDANKNEIQHLDFSEGERRWIAHTGASISPDNNYVAFFTTNGNYENPDFHIFVYDISKNTVKKVGETSYAERLEWKDNNTFINIVKNVENGIEKEEEREVFNIK